MIKYILLGLNIFALMFSPSALIMASFLEKIGLEFLSERLSGAFFWSFFFRLDLALNPILLLLLFIAIGTLFIIERKIEKNKTFLVWINFILVIMNTAGLFLFFLGLLTGAISFNFG